MAQMPMQPGQPDDSPQQEQQEAPDKMCVLIEVDADGSVMVGAIPPEMQAQLEQGEEQFLQPAKTVDDALSTARDLLSGDTGAQAQDAEASFQSGFDKTQSGGMYRP